MIFHYPWVHELAAASLTPPRPPGVSYVSAPEFASDALGLQPLKSTGHRP